MALLLLLLALCGLANAVYFALLYYRVVKPDSGRIPGFCRIGEPTCHAVVFTRYGSLFFVPNSLPGIIFYLLLIDVALTKLLTGEYHRLDYALAAALFTVPIGIYLVYALLVKLKQH